METRLSILFNYLYNSDNRECYNINDITLGKIGMEDIKIIYSTEAENNELKKEVLTGKFKFIKVDDESDKSEKSLKYYYKKTSSSFPLLYKISIYNDKGQTHNSMSNECNNDSLFSYLLSSLVLKNLTTHILLPLVNIDFPVSMVKDIFNLKDVNDGMCCIQVRENFFKSYTLDEYLKINKLTPNSYKILLFQIIYTIAKIQEVYPDFCHNSLLLNNILVYEKSTEPNKYFGFKNDEFNVRGHDFSIKIMNFEKASIKKYYENNNMQNHNSYYDVYLLLNDLLENSLNLSNKLDKDTMKFLDRIIPEKIRGIKQYNGQLVILPKDILYDEYFEDLLIKPSKKEVKRSFADNIGSRSFVMNSDNDTELGNQRILIKKIKSKTNIMSKNSETFSRKIKDDNDIIVKLNRTRLLSKSTILTGGSNKPLLSSFNQSTLGPNMSNDQKETFKKRSIDNPPENKNILLEQTIYNPPPQQSKSSNTKDYPEPQYIPLYDPNGKMMSGMVPYNNMVYQDPMQKIYNVTVNNPIGNYTTINRIYEDVLPSSINTLTALTTFERMQLIDFMRNSMIKNNDGEEMALSGGNNSLSSYVKIMNINPYTLKINPYEDLSTNFLLYRAGYPVKHDPKGNQIGLSKMAMGVNIRIYLLSVGALRCKTIGEMINSENFDVWRELKYYDWVRNNVIKKKLSPNFIAPILYKIDDNTKIDWKKLDMIRGKNRTNATIEALNENQRLINIKHNLPKQLGTFAALLNPQYIKQNTIQTSQNRQLRRTIRMPNPNEIEEDEKQDITLNSNKMLILLTEAPTLSLLQWASATYEAKGSIRKMIRTGYHSPDVWRSIIFQLVYVFAVLQKEEVYLENMTLEDNFYIKDMHYDMTAIGSWIYKVKGIDYYVPNYGSLLVFDTKFKELSFQQNFVPNQNQNQNIKYRIYGRNIYTDNSDFDMTHIRQTIYNKFKDIIHPDNFTQHMKAEGGSVPDDSIVQLLRNIHNDNNNNIDDLFMLYFRDFVHNRVGTPLTKIEKENTNTLTRPIFNRSKLVVHRTNNTDYKWVLYIQDAPLSANHINAINAANAVAAANAANPNGVAVAAANVANAAAAYIIAANAANQAAAPAIVAAAGVNQVPAAVAAAIAGANINLKQILTRNDTTGELELIFVNKSRLLYYPDNEKIYPTSSKTMKYDESYIYETYML